MPTFANGIPGTQSRMSVVCEELVTGRNSVSVVAREQADTRLTSATPRRES